MYLIVRCPECSTPQYITDIQKSRKCPKCGKHLKCRKLRIFARAMDITEANQIVRSIKTPSGLHSKIATLNASMLSSKSNTQQKFDALSKLLTTLLEIFPKRIPENFIFQKAKEAGFDDTGFITDIFEKMNQEGVLLKHKDNEGNNYVQFPSLPLEFGKLYIKKTKNPKQKKRR